MYFVLFFDAFLVLKTMENTMYVAYLKSDKWRRIARARLEIDGYTCQGCGCNGTAVNPLEVHHVSYRHLYEEEKWIYEDLVCLCHVCHKLIHRVMNRQTSKDGRRGWKDGNIPQVHAYNLNGIIEHKEDKKT